MLCGEGTPEGKGSRGEGGKDYSREALVPWTLPIHHRARKESKRGAGGDRDGRGQDRRWFLPLSELSELSLQPTAGHIGTPAPIRRLPGPSRVARAAQYLLLWSRTYLPPVCVTLGLDPLSPPSLLEDGQGGENTHTTPSKQASH